MNKDLEALKQEYLEAIDNLRLARQNFQYATPEYFEIANTELTIALTKVGACRKKFDALI